MRKKINKKMFLIIPIILFVFGGMTYYFAIYNHIKTIKVDSDYIMYEAPDDLIKNSDLIAVVTTNVPVEKREPKLSYTEGTMSNFNTLTKVTIKKIIKKPANFKYTVGTEIKLSEPFAIIQTSTGKQLLLKDEYTPLLTDKEYMIFANVTSEGACYIINRDLGVYNITDNEEQPNDKNNKYIYNNKEEQTYIKERKEKYLNMKKDLANKLNIQIK